MFFLEWWLNNKGNYRVKRMALIVGIKRETSREIIRRIKKGESLSFFSCL